MVPGTTASTICTTVLAFAQFRTAIRAHNGGRSLKSTPSLMSKALVVHVQHHSRLFERCLRVDMCNLWR